MRVGGFFPGAAVPFVFRGERSLVAFSLAGLARSNADTRTTPCPAEPRANPAAVAFQSWFTVDEMEGMNSGV